MADPARREQQKLIQPNLGQNFLTWTHHYIGTWGILVLFPGFGGSPCFARLLCAPDSVAQWRAPRTTFHLCLPLCLEFESYESSKVMPNKSKRPLNSPEVSQLPYKRPEVELSNTHRSVIAFQL